MEARGECEHSPDPGAHAPRAAAEALSPPPPPSAQAVGLRQRLRSIASTAAFVLGGGVVGLAAARFDIPLMSDLPPGMALVALAGFLGALWPNVLLHEAGHALGGLACGMRALAFGVGPFRLERGTGGWRLRHGGRLRGISGFAALFPDGERGIAPRHQACFLLGGPLANLAAAALGLALLPLAPAAWAAALLQGAILAALALGVVNLVPFQVQGWRSDGRGLLDLLRGAPDAALQLQMNRLMALSLAGVRPRDWPHALLPAPPEDAAAPMLALGTRALLLTHAADSRDDAAARGHAQALATRFWEAPESYRPHLAVGLAGHAATMLRDPALLAAWRPLCEGGMLDLSPYRSWLDAELAALTGDAATARRHLDTARAMLGRVQDPASLLVLRDHLDALAERLPPA